MLTDPQLPFLGAIIVELRTDVDLRALVGTRVRGYRPQGGAEGDVQGAGHYKRFVVVSVLSAPVEPSLPITFAEVGVRAYGTDDTDAWAVWAALVKAIHAVGPRVHTSGLGIYRTAILTGGTQDQDPDTDQPMVTGSFQVIATAQVVV
jgi:hypothetical protein